MLVKKDEIYSVYQDLTGRFPVKLSQGNEYVFGSYNYNINFIIGVPIKVEQQ